MTEDHSRTRAYEPGSTPIPAPDPHLNATRPFTPGAAPLPPNPPPYAQPPYGPSPTDR